MYTDFKSDLRAPDFDGNDANTRTSRWNWEVFILSKVMSLHDAVAKYVHDGDSISFGGFTTNRKPYAAVHEILRQGQKDFIVYAGPAGGDWDMLIGEGRVKAYINCYTANSGYTNVSRRFRAAIEKNEVLFEDYSQDAIMFMLHASSLGLPFLPVRFMIGSGMVDEWGISKEVRQTIDKLPNDKYVYLDNPFTGEKTVALPVPKLDTAIIHVQMASPDGTCRILGDEFHDVDIAIAAKNVIVTCEELVTNEYIRRDPTQNKIFGECVNAVVHCPKGAHPSQVYGYYDYDPAYFKEYDAASKYQDGPDAVAQLKKAAAKAQKALDKKPGDEKLAAALEKANQAAADAESGAKVPETFRDFCEKYVYSVKSHEEYLDKLGATRLLKLLDTSGFGYAAQLDAIER